MIVMASIGGVGGSGGFAGSIALVTSMQHYPTSKVSCRWHRWAVPVLSASCVSNSPMKQGSVSELLVRQVTPPTTSEGVPRHLYHSHFSAGNIPLTARVSDGSATSAIDYKGPVAATVIAGLKNS
jgi:hypothetical protein